MKRKATTVAERALAAIQRTPPTEIHAMLGTIADTLSDLKLRLADTGYRSMVDVTNDLSRLHTDLKAGKSMAIRTGYAPLDEMLRFGGFSPGQLIVLAAPPAGAKTGLAGGFALNVARRGGSCGFFTREMSDVDLGLRLEASFGEVPLWQIADSMTPAVFAHLQSNLKKLAELKIFFDSGSSTIDMMAAQARQMKKQEDIDLIIIDYLQLMRLNGGRHIGDQNRAAEVAEISRQLKTLAGNLGVPVVALSQISNEGIKKGKAGGVHLKESGAIQADADVVIFIDAEPIEEGEPPPELQPVQFRISKQRNGPTGACNMIFRRADVSFHAPRAGSSLVLNPITSAKVAAAPPVKATPKPAAFTIETVVQPEPAPHRAEQSETFTRPEDDYDFLGDDSPIAIPDEIVMVGVEEWTDDNLPF